MFLRPSRPARGSGGGYFRSTTMSQERGAGRREGGRPALLRTSGAAPSGADREAEINVR